MSGSTGIGGMDDVIAPLRFRRNVVAEGAAWLDARQHAGLLYP